MRRRGRRRPAILDEADAVLALVPPGFDTALPAAGQHEVRRPDHRPEPPAAARSA